MINIPVKRKKNKDKKVAPRSRLQIYLKDRGGLSEENLKRQPLDEQHPGYL